MIAPIREAVEQWEPRATVKDVFFTRSMDGSGKLAAHVEIEINGQ
jgi:phage baseplate assembly protein W